MSNMALDKPVSAMTDQQVVDTVGAHLVKQGVMSVDARGDCVYRDAYGNECAIGCLIPDELYDPKMENIAIDHKTMPLFSGINDYLGLHSPSRVLLLSKLQSLHDDGQLSTNTDPNLSAYWKRMIHSIL